MASGSGWNLWVRYIDFLILLIPPHITYPYSSCICSFLQQHPYFLFIFLNYIYYYYYVVVVFKCKQL